MRTVYGCDVYFLWRQYIKPNYLMFLVYIYTGFRANVRVYLLKIAQIKFSYVFYLCRNIPHAT